MVRIEITDANGVVVRQVQTESYHLAWEEGGKLQMQGTLSLAGIVAAAMPHLGKFIGFPFGGGRKG